MTLAGSWRRRAWLLSCCLSVGFGARLVGAAPTATAPVAPATPAVNAGRLMRALDPSGAVRGTVPVYYEFYPHYGRGRSQGTLVATEGGPGYPATESRDDYLTLFKPLMATHDVLIMDNRGTGRSGAIDCHALQTAPQWTERAVGDCGKALGVRAPLYSTTYAADDLAAVLDRLKIQRIDLYGDSYGTYFEQVFAIRHPDRLRSLILDGAYPLAGPDYAWYSSYAPAMRAKFDLACQRSVECSALSGSSIDHVMPALDLLRRNPVAAVGRDINGMERQFRADASHLATVMFTSAPKLTSAREVDAAARAYATGDTLPLLRLMAESAAAVDSRDPTGDPTRWSAGLAAAVMCQDPPQIFDMRLAPELRRADRERALAERRLQHPDTYAPFTIDEYRGMPLDYSFLDQCVEWPVSVPSHPAGEVGVNARYPDVPALILSGEFDNITTLADGAAVAAAFRRGVQIRLANSFHVNALPRARSSCGAEIAQHFFSTLDVGDASCATRVPPVKVLARFARQSSDLVPALGVQGNRAARVQLQLVAAAILTAADVVARARESEGSTQGVGLRSGTFHQEHIAGGIRVILDSVRWTEDAALSGTIECTAGQVGVIHAALRLTAANGSTGQLNARWIDGSTDPDADVRVDGVIDGAAVAASLPTP